MSDALTVSLPRFKGPLDLLLSLVRKNEVVITDIPIAEITRQYLDYIHQAEKLDIDVGGEFPFMAATLIWIKTRSLLPRDPPLPSAERDPRQELINQLLDHEEVRRKAVEFFREKLEDSQNSWSHSLPEEFCELGTTPMEEPPPSPDTLNVFDVIRLAQKVLEIARAHGSWDLRREEITVNDMIRWLEERLKNTQPGEALDGATLFEEQAAVERKIVLFLTLLEMARLGSLCLCQEIPLGKLSVTRPARAQSVCRSAVLDGGR